MQYIQDKNGGYIGLHKVITQSEYDKATITYDTLVKTPITEDKEVEHTIVDAHNKTIILCTKTVQVPVMETVKVKELNGDGKEHTVKQCYKEDIKKVTYNQYDGYVIIPDDSTILTEDEYKKEIEKLKKI